ncbi:WD40-repeat-containing domain protein [Earliella scabrosa]|nr:WD40-repeat-containing domain protein [Earliella scabrosa]
MAASLDGRYLCTASHIHLQIRDFVDIGSAGTRSLYLQDGLQQEALSLTYVRCLSFSPSNRDLVCGGVTGRLEKSSLELPLHFYRQDGLELHALDGHVKTVNTTTWSWDGMLLASGADDETVRIWDTKTHGQVHVLTHKAPVTLVLFSPDGHWLVSCGTDGTLRVWNATTGGTHRSFQENQSGNVRTAAFDPNPEDNRIAIGMEDGSVHLWNVASGHTEFTLHEHRAPILSLSYSPDGADILTASADSTATVCDARTGERLVRLHGHYGPVNVAIYSPDGKHIATGSSDYAVRVWDRREGVCAMVIDEHSAEVKQLAFVSGGRILVSSALDGRVLMHYGLP